MDRAGFQSKLDLALERRAASLRVGHTTAYRVLNGRGDGTPDVAVDVFGDVAVLSAYRPFSSEEEQLMGHALHEALGLRAVYLKRRPKEARVVANVAREVVAPEVPLVGDAVEELEAMENGLRFVIRPGQGLSVGLYLDMRETRAWVRGQVSGKTVLNCFAYTCAFGVYAHAGGCARAVNLDLSRRVLDWGEENLRRNGFPADRRDHISGDTFEWLGRFTRKGERFDCVILDPPSFSTSKKGRFSAARDYGKLVAAAAPVVAGGGLLVACCNLEELTGPRFEAMVLGGLEQAGRRGRLVESLGPSPVDFPSHTQESAGLKVRVFSLHG